GGATHEIQPFRRLRRTSAGNNNLSSPDPFRLLRISVRPPSDQPPPGKHSSNSLKPVEKFPCSETERRSPARQTPGRLSSFTDCSLQVPIPDHAHDHPFDHHSLRCKIDMDGFEIGIL